MTDHELYERLEALQREAEVLGMDISTTKSLVRNRIIGGTTVEPVWVADHSIANCHSNDGCSGCIKFE